LKRKKNGKRKTGKRKSGKRKNGRKPSLTRLFPISLSPEKFLARHFSDLKARNNLWLKAVSC